MSDYLFGILIWSVFCHLLALSEYHFWSLVKYTFVQISDEFNSGNKMCSNASQFRRMQKCRCQPMVWVFGGAAVWGENWSLWEGYAGPDPGHNKTCECEIQLKGKQLMKLHNKGNIISPPFSKISPPFFEFISFTGLFSQLHTAKFS